MVKITLKINGMMCGMCESHINDVIRKTIPVKKISSSHSKGETEIIAEAPLDEDRLRMAIGETGYELVSVSTEEYVKKGFFHRG